MSAIPVGPYPSREAYEAARDASVGTEALRDRERAVLDAAGAVVDAWREVAAGRKADPHDPISVALDRLSATVAELRKAGGK